MEVSLVVPVLEFNNNAMGVAHPLGFLRMFYLDLGSHIFLGAPFSCRLCGTGVYSVILLHLGCVCLIYWYPWKYFIGGALTFTTSITWFTDAVWRFSNYTHCFCVGWLHWLLWPEKSITAHAGWPATILASFYTRPVLVVPTDIPPPSGDVLYFIGTDTHHNWLP